ncbi:MAG: GNAT family N-acetyltransferase [Candidatus Magnetomorum sp.]|nr:GNAT family N-acetyltransferase [Candidatus Magnetomorum sp.]
MKASPFFFRQATHDDIDDLLRLLHILFDFEEIPFQSSKHRKALNMILNTDQTCIMIAETNEKIVGMCAAQLFISTAEGGYAAFIEDIVVEPDYRKQGIANILLKKMEQWAQNKQVIRLQLLVNQKNEAAKKLYHQHDFRSTPCVFMKKNI